VDNVLIRHNGVCGCLLQVRVFMSQVHTMRFSEVCRYLNTAPADEVLEQLQVSCLACWPSNSA